MGKGGAEAGFHVMLKNFEKEQKLSVNIDCREKVKINKRERATHGQIDRAYKPIRTRASLRVCYKRLYLNHSFYALWEKKNGRKLIEKNTNGCILGFHVT